MQCFTNIIHNQQYYVLNNQIKSAHSDTKKPFVFSQVIYAEQSTENSNCNLK